MKWKLLINFLSIDYYKNCETIDIIHELSHGAKQTIAPGICQVKKAKKLWAPSSNTCRYSQHRNTSENFSDSRDSRSWMNFFWRRQPCIKLTKENWSGKCFFLFFFSLIIFAREKNKSNNGKVSVAKCLWNPILWCSCDDLFPEFEVEWLRSWYIY